MSWVVAYVSYSGSGPRHSSSLAYTVYFTNFQSIIDVKNTAQFDELQFGVLTYILVKLSPQS